MIVFRYLSRTFFAASMGAAVMLLFLFSVFQFLTETQSYLKAGKGVWGAFLELLLELPLNAYMLFPLGILLGSLMAASMLARYNEMTALRVSGFSVKRITMLLCPMSLLLAGITWGIGEWLTPLSQRLEMRLTLGALQQNTALQTLASGVWLKDKDDFVRIAFVGKDHDLYGITIYQFDNASNRLLLVAEASSAQIEKNAWLLKQVQLTNLQDDAKITRQTLAQYRHPVQISPSTIAALAVPPEEMDFGDLRHYIRYLKENNQKSQSYEIALWFKLAYPLAAAIMPLFALSFGFAPPRSGIAARLVVGIILGMAFDMSNRILGNLSLLVNLPPPLVAFLPTLVFMLAAFLLLWRAERH
jgi:lipopolysaccharide export system permease protein